MKKFMLLWVFVLSTTGVAWGEKPPINLNKEAVDHSQYHKLHTSNIIFNSIKGKPTLVTLGFKDEDFDKYFRSSPLQPVLTGKATLYSVQGKQQVFHLFFTQDLKGKGGITPVTGWNRLTSKILFDENTLKTVQPKRGEYMLILEVYIPKDIPANLEHVIELKELDQLK